MFLLKRAACLLLGRYSHLGDGARVHESKNPKLVRADNVLHQVEPNYVRVRVAPRGAQVIKMDGRLQHFLVRQHLLPANLVPEGPLITLCVKVRNAR